MLLFLISAFLLWNSYQDNKQIKELQDVQNKSASLINGHSLILRTIVNQGMRVTLIDLDTMVRKQRIWEDLQKVQGKLDSLRNDYIEDPSNKETETQLLLMLEKVRAIQNQKIR